MQLRKSRLFLFARGSQLDNVVTSPGLTLRGNVVHTMDHEVVLRPCKIL